MILLSSNVVSLLPVVSKVELLRVIRDESVGDHNIAGIILLEICSPTADLDLTQGRVNNSLVRLLVLASISYGNRLVLG